MAGSPGETDDYLAGLAPVGWRLGLDRMSRLLFALGMPQRRFASIHVVGTNGKSSTTRYAAAILDSAGIPAGAYLSPHERRWSERILIGGEEIGTERLDEAIVQVRLAAEAVERGFEEGERVTQFEAVTAAAFVALAAARVRVGVIEAGLGGRLDATNVLTSKVTVLTSIGNDHTEWLGETETEIAAEKLAVLNDHSTLVLGDVSGDVEGLACETAKSRHAAVDRAEGARSRVPDEIRAPYLRRNFALALTAVELCVGPVADGVLPAAARAADLHGRMEKVEVGGVPVILDVAHNPEGAAALAEALEREASTIAPAPPVFACIAILGDKNAALMLAALVPRLAGAVFTSIPQAEVASLGRPGAASHEPSALAGLARDAGLDAVETVDDPAAAVARTLEQAAEVGGVALVTGSHYLLRYVEEG